MRLSALVVSALFCVAVIAATMALGDVSLERAALLAPVLVVSAGGIAFLVVLWAKVIRESLRGRGDE